MAHIIVTGAHIGGRSGEVSIHKGSGKLVGSIIHVNIGALPIFRCGNPKGRRTVSASKGDRIAFVKSNVVGRAREFLTFDENLQRVGF